MRDVARHRAVTQAFLILAAVLLEVGSAAAQARTSRLCVPDDMPGTWDVVSMSTVFRIDRSDPYYYAHQRYVFEGGGVVRHMTSTRPFDPTEFRAFLLAPATSTWSLDGGGRLIVTRQTDQEGAICTIGLAPVGELQAGDVVLTYFDANRQPVLKRVLRKRP